jgi:uncharacterized membrane protein YphA (DoxX/SURF4 family)
MNSLDRFMEFLLSGVFLCAGLVKIFSYNRKAKEPGNQETTGLMGLPYTCAALIGLFEIVAALALIAPVGPSLSPTFAIVTASALALLMVGASIYRVRHQQSAAPTIALFLMALFVLAARCL